MKETEHTYQREGQEIVWSQSVKLYIGIRLFSLANKDMMAYIWKLKLDKFKQEI